MYLSRRKIGKLAVVLAAGVLEMVIGALELGFAGGGELHAIVELNDVLLRAAAKRERA